MTRSRREGWPIVLPDGWQDMSDDERRAWWDHVWNRRIEPQLLVPPKGRPSALAWSGSLVARRLRIVCGACGRLLAQLDDYERGPVMSRFVGERHLSGYGRKVTCPEHGRLPASVALLRPRLEAARRSGRVLTVKVR